MSNRVQRIFHQAFNGLPNHVTPDVLEYGKAGPYVYELSRGCFGSVEVYGVTVLTASGQRTEKSQSFDTKTAARAYLVTLAQEQTS